MAILIDENTRILIQGITGREAATFTNESIQYGARIVAGVTPGKRGIQVHGVPVFDTVSSAIKAEPCDASVISVPAPFVYEASIEAINNGLQLLVVVTERVPRKDIIAILEIAKVADVRIIGPNSLGVISPERSRLGMCGGAAEDVRKAYTLGSVGIISRSGGMTTEIASMLSQVGIGQSTCVSIGGDPIIGSTYLDLLSLYEEDSQTQALVLFCEPGGTMEERLADHLKLHGSRLPIIAFVAGRFADNMQGQRFGHAGAIVEGKRGSPANKIMVLQQAGVHIAEKLSDIPKLVQDVITNEFLNESIHTN